MINIWEKIIEMIPQIIHYCWFGGNPLPKSAQKCIESWKRFLPNYEIKRWDESNYNVRKIPYLAEAYDAKKYAFVSDYARFDILYQYGGLYFDTDVEVIKPFDAILAQGAFMGCEIDAPKIDVNPGLGVAVEAHNILCKAIMDSYVTEHFVEADGAYNLTTIVKRTTKVLSEYGLKNTQGIQMVGGIKIYPQEYFNPLNDVTGELIITIKTYSIHWYSKTWQKKSGIIRGKITRIFHRWLGEDCFRWIKILLSNSNRF